MRVDQQTQTASNSIIASIVVVFVLILGLLGCNRVPTSAVPTARVAPAKKVVKKAPVVSPEVAVRVEPIAELCERTCVHWTDLKFSAPIGLDTMRVRAHLQAQEMLERQRTHNRARCEMLCVQSADRERAKCILLSETAEAIEQCSNPKAAEIQRVDEEASLEKPALERVTPKRPGLHRRYISRPKASRQAPRRPAAPRSPYRHQNRSQ